MKYIIKNIVVGVFTKVSGLIVFIIINKYYGVTSEVGKVIYYWSMAIFVQSVFLLPMLYYSISIGKPIFLIYEKFIILILIMVMIFSIFMEIKYLIPFVIWLIILTINLRIDFNLLVKKENIRYLYSNTFKNILLIFIFPLVSINYIFYWLAIGELVKTIIFNKKINIYISQKKFKLKQLLLYILYLFFVGIIFILDKSFLYFYDPKLIVDYELIYKFMEIFLTLLSAGLVPLFVAKINEEDSINIIKYIVLLSIFLIVILYILLYFYSMFVYNFFNFNIKYSEMIFLLRTTILILFPMSILTFTRKKVALMISRELFLFYLMVIIEKILIYLFILNKKIVILKVLYVNNFIILLIETLYIFFLLRRIKL